MEPELVTEADFFACQARLQAEARMALAQAKEMAHMQMEVERQHQQKSPITEMVRSSLEKVIHSLFTLYQKCKLCEVSDMNWRFIKRCTSICLNVNIVTFSSPIYIIFLTIFSLLVNISIQYLCSYGVTLSDFKMNSAFTASFCRTSLSDIQ
jgi:hypothetical protein